MSRKKTTYSIEIYAGIGVQENAYGVNLCDVISHTNQLLRSCPIHLFSSDDGLDIQIRKEEVADSIKIAESLAKEVSKHD